MHTRIKEYIESLNSQMIPESRRHVLISLIYYIRKRINEDQPVSLIFICTHNSRRSQLAQVWMQALSSYYLWDKVQCYSGGTEATAVHPVVVETLKKTGFNIEKCNNDKNPIYKIDYQEDKDPLHINSKRYGDINNPVSQFVAIMTCSEADRDCPMVPGAEKWISIPYDDPKVYDGTPEQEIIYLERSREIATEMKYVVKQVRKYQDHKEHHSYIR